MNIISKRKEIVELLEKGTEVDEICTILGVSTSYVYRIKREIDEFEDNSEDSTNAEEVRTDDLAIDSTSGDGTDVEGDSKNMENEEKQVKTDNTNELGGVKKRKRKSRKIKKDVEIEVEKIGVLKWIKLKWKRMLLISSVLILLILTMLSSYLTKSKEETPSIQARPSRFPMMRH